MTTVHYPNYSRVSDSAYDLEIDFEDFYIFASELPVGSFHPTIEYLFEQDGKIHRFTRDGENRIIRQIALSGDYRR
ncbi:MAG: hypothetical protein MZU97_17645 [Bacillus subtilis]|nr:hypothetical protein [Bacillus subtilis]